MVPTKYSSLRLRSYTIRSYTNPNPKLYEREKKLDTQILEIKQQQLKLDNEQRLFKEAKAKWRVNMGEKAKILSNLAQLEVESEED